MAWVRNDLIISSNIDSYGRNTVREERFLFDGSIVYKPVKGKKFPPEGKITHALGDSLLEWNTLTYKK